MAFVHPLDEPLLAANYGGDVGAIPKKLLDLYCRAIKFYHGAGGAIGELGPQSLAVIIAVYEMLGDDGVKPSGLVAHTSESLKVDEPADNALNPYRQASKDAKVYVNGKLGYLVGAWGNDKVRVRMEGDPEDKPYRVYPIIEVQMAG